MKVTLRSATVEDRQALWQVHTQAIRQTARSHYDATEIEAWAGRLRAEYYQLHPGLFLVAEDEEGGVIGFGELNVEAREIEAVFVSPEYGRCGVGRQILCALENLARQHELCELQLDASLNAVGFYEQAGYRQDKPTVREYGKNKVKVAGVLMTKSLAAEAEQAAHC
jgi:putative acetyltransferase